MILEKHLFAESILQFDAKVDTPGYRTEPNLIIVI